MCLTGALAPHTHAAPDEIVVFADEFEKRGHVGYELHFNYAAAARKTPDYFGEQAPHHILRVMPEVAWGFADKWNVAVHLPLSHNPHDRSTTLDGVKPRLHYLNVIERGTDSTLFYGVNFEIAAYNKRITESRYHGEIRTIIGTRQGEWKFSLNPIFNQALSENPAGRAETLEVFGQAMRHLGNGFSVGVEHYATPGRLSHLSWGAGSEQTSYLVADFKPSMRLEIHVGVGHGWSGSTDKLVYKAMIGLPF